MNDRANGEEDFVMLFVLCIIFIVVMAWGSYQGQINSDITSTVTVANVNSWGIRSFTDTSGNGYEIAWHIIHTISAGENMTIWYHIDTVTRVRIVDKIVDIIGYNYQCKNVSGVCQ